MFFRRNNIKFMKKNDALKEYVTRKYGSTAKFSKKEKYPMAHLEIMFEKKDIFHEISICIKLCDFLNIDAEKLFCDNKMPREEINKPKSADEYPSAPLDDEIKEKYAKLNAAEREKTLNFVNYILEA